MSPELEILRDEMRRGFELLDQRLGRMEGRLDGMAGRLDGMDGRLDRLDGRLDGTDGRLNRLEEQTRRNGVLIEALHDDIQRLAEAQIALSERVERYRLENEAAHEDIKGLIHLTYRELDRRIRDVESRSHGEGPP